MANDKFSIKEAINYGWGSFKSQIPFFIGLIVVVILVTVLPDIVIKKLFEQGTAAYVVLELIVRLIGLMMGMVATRISLDIHDAGKADLSRLSELVSYIPYYLGGKILYGLIVLGGMILLIVPGMIWAYMFLYVGYIIIDKGSSPIAALKESREITRGYKMDLFLFSLAVAGINLVGAVCLFVGLLVSIPVTLMASVYVYRRLSPALRPDTSPPPIRYNSPVTLDEQREQMVQEQLFARGILDPRILDAFRTIPRDIFIPSSQQPRAYEDRALGVGFDQTISQPYMVGTMLKVLALKGPEKVLEIGTGTGYEAALLGRLAREVHTVEIIPALAAQAREILSSLGLTNVHVHDGDGSRGWPEQAPFDAIVIAAATPSVPAPLLDQLGDGGKLLAPIGQGSHEMLTLFEKKGMAMEKRFFGECAFVPLMGEFGKQRG